MKFVVALALTLVVVSPTAAFAQTDVSPDGCSSPIDFRIVGAWQSEDGAERREFLPQSRSQTLEGLPVTTEACMAMPDDLQETASVEVAPHVRTMTETHYHIGFIGLDRVVVTFPNGVVRLFRRIAAAPGRVLDVVAHRGRS